MSREETSREGDEALLASADYIVKDFSGRLRVACPNVPREELTAIGRLALVENLRRYDPTRGASFATFCYLRVRGSMLDHARKEIGRGLHLDGLEHAVRDEEAETDPLAMDERTDKQEALDMLRGRIAGFVGTLALNRTVAAPSAEESHLAEARNRRVRDQVEQLPEEERAFVAQFYDEGMTLDQIAENRRTSKRTVSRIHERIKNKLSKRLLRLDD